MEWTDDFLLGIPSIDAQHKQLINLLDLFHIALKKGETQSAYANTIRALVDYTQHHFADEEEYMSRIGYPKLADHKRLHANLINETRNILFQLKNGHPIHAISLHRFLNDWVCNHILDEDHKIARYSHSRQSPPPSEAAHPNPLGVEGEELLAGFQSLGKQREHKALSPADYMSQALEILNNGFGRFNIATPKRIELALAFIGYLSEREIVSQADAEVFKKAAVKKALASKILSGFPDSDSRHGFLAHLLQKKLLTAEEMEAAQHTG